MTALRKARRRIRRLVAMVANLRARLTASQNRTVWHGTNPTAPRPTTSKPVVWVGTATPTHAANGDVHINTTATQTAGAWQDQLTDRRTA